MGTMGTPYGLQSMLKEGYKHLSGVDEAVLQNIEACNGLYKITRTSMGPNGMNKLVVNHLDKLFVSSDAGVIVNELELQHPAAKMVVLAARAQDTEIGDGTNFVVSFAGSLLNNAGALLREGLHTSEIADGYEKACTKALETLEGLVLAGTETVDIRDEGAVATRLRASVASKQSGHEGTLCALIARACIHVCPKNPHNFNVDNVRVAKIVGASLPQSEVVRGMLFKRPVEGVVKKVADAKVCVFAQGLDTTGTETKGTVLIRNAEELENYSRSEEDTLEGYVKAIADAGVKVVAAGGTIGEMALHFLDKYGIMGIKIPSKFELRRFCRATGAAALVKLAAPSAEQLGFAKSLGVREVGGTQCVVLQQDAGMGQVATIVLRGATDNILTDVERAVDDGINTYKALVKDSRGLPGGGATEIALCRALSEYAKQQPGLEQYALTKFAEAFEVVPRTLAENSGLNASEVLSALHAAHAEGLTRSGVNLETGGAADLSADVVVNAAARTQGGEVVDPRADVEEASGSIVDLYATKWWAIKLAANAVVTVLRVDQLIMAKQAGGPAPRGPGAMDED